MPIAAAGISAGASLLGGITSGKGAAKAAKINAAAYQSGINEQHNEFNTVQANNAPYMAAGTTSLDAMLNLLGLGSGGTTGQQTAIDALKTSPAYTSVYGSGLDALNQSEAATGGLRGGNGALAESNFGATTLQNIIQQSLGNYGGLVSTGQAAAGGTNSAALSTGANVANLLAKQGTAQGTAAASPYGSLASILNGVGSAANSYLGSGAGFNTLIGQPDAAFDAAYGFSNPKGW